MSDHSLPRPDSTTEGSARAGAAVIIALFILSALLSATNKSVTQGFDELAHVSYVAQIQTDRTFWPDLNSLRMLNPVSFRRTGEGNYLNHLPLFYDVLATIGPRLDSHPEAIWWHRMLNIAIDGVGLYALFVIGLGMDWEPLERYAYFIPIAATPVLAALAGAVNNDNAAFTGGAITLLGIYRLLANEQQRWLAIALGGLLIASWSKLTGLLLTGTMLSAAFGYLVWKRRFLGHWTWPVIAALVLSALPYVVFTLNYGSPAPDTPAQEALLRSGSALAGWNDRPRLSSVSYIVHFLSDFLSDWMPTLAQRSTFQFGMLAIPAAAMALAGVGSLVSARRILLGREAPSDVLIVTGTIAIAATLMCHVYFSYQRHIATGWMMDAYPRYYLPMMAIVPLACLSFSATIRNQQVRRFIVASFVAGPLLFAFLGSRLGG